MTDVPVRVGLVGAGLWAPARAPTASRRRRRSRPCSPGCSRPARARRRRRRTGHHPRHDDHPALVLEPVLFPWGYDSRVKAPNDAGLRALAARLAGITGYRYGQPGEVLYNASGGTDDWTYDRLGIASFTFEVGPTSGTCGGFTPPYSCQSSTFWPLVKPALRYAARTAGSPYRLPAAARAA